MYLVASVDGQQTYQAAIVAPPRIVVGIRAIEHLQQRRANNRVYQQANLRNDETGTRWERERSVEIDRQRDKQADRYTRQTDKQTRQKIR